jgi:methyl-accepting chemotaxis protein
MIAWWRNSRLITKLSVCGLSFILPIALLLAFLSREMLQGIELTELELSGMELMAPLEDINELLPGHLRLCLARLAGQNVDAALTQSEQNLADKLEDLTRHAGRNARTVGLDHQALAQSGLTRLEPGEFTKQITALLTSRLATPEQTIQAHAQVLALVDQMRDYLADSTKLMLDPELPSFHLVYILTNDLPRMLEYMGKLQVLEYMSQNKTAKPDQEHQAPGGQAESGWAQALRERIVAKIGKVLPGLDTTQAANLSQATERCKEATANFLALYFGQTAKPDQASLDRLMQAGDAALKAGGDLWDLGNAQFQTMLKSRAMVLKWRMVAALGICLISILAATLISWGIVKSISTPISQAALIAGGIAKGKVAQAAKQLAQAMPKDLDRQGEDAKNLSETLLLYRSLSGMVQGLDGLLQEVGRSGGRISASAQRIAVSARQLEATATQQAASTTEVGATSKEISATAGDLAETMSQVLGVAKKSSELAEEGRQDLTRMDLVMDELGLASRDMTGKLEDIREKTSGIGRFLSTIAKVANQTNLLSLNAAIEAEKAGEFGPGFAVVAREIRRLADQTAKAALDIERNINDMQASVRAGVSAMAEFSDKAAQAAQTSQAVGQRLGRIIEAGEQLTPRFSNVSSGMSQQAEGADQISEVIAQLAQGAGQTRDSLAEFRKAAEELGETASGLRAWLANFDLEA